MNWRTPIGARLSLELDDEYRRMLNEWFFKWHFIGGDRPVDIDSFDGRTISYSGIGFSGTAQDVYWATIQWYLRKKVGVIFDGVENEIARYPLDVRERTLKEVQSIVEYFAARIRRATIEKDRILRGNGHEFPPERDCGEWLGCQLSDIEKRASILLDIYCDKKITIDGAEMSLKSMMTDKLTLVKKDGSVSREGIQGLVTKGRITTFQHDLPIEPGDHLLRELPSGLVDDFIVIDPGYFGGLSGARGPHFQVEVTRSDVPAASQQTVVQNITNNLVGPHARVNINSTDNSINTHGRIDVERLSDFLTQLRPAIMGLPAAQQKEVAAPLEILEAEVKGPIPSQSKIRNALLSIQRVAEQATGNLVAVGIGGLIATLLSAS